MMAMICDLCSAVVKIPRCFDGRPVGLEPRPTGWESILEQDTCPKCREAIEARMKDLREGK